MHRTCTDTGMYFNSMITFTAVTPLDAAPAPEEDAPSTTATATP